MSRFPRSARLSQRQRSLRRQRLSIETLESRRLLATYTVNSTSDEGDSFVDDGICDTSNNPTTDPPTPPSNVCTLRAALIQSFANDGGDTIEFNIPGAPDFVPVIPGIVAIPQNTIVDGTTQPSGQVIIQGDVNISGNGATLRGLFVQDVIDVATNDNTIQGVIAESMSVRGNDNQIGGIDIGESVTILDGGLGISGNNNVLEGSFIGFNPETGAVDGNPSLTGLGVGGTGNRIGGAELGAGNVIGGFGTGIGLGSNDLNDPIENSGNVVQGNFIGVRPDGTPLPNASIGIRVIAMTGVKIGGELAGEGNVISSSGVGIQLSQHGSETTIQGNFIGTNIEGTEALAGQRIGIEIDPQGRPEDPPVMNMIGGTVPGAANVISGNTEFGIRLFNGPRDNVIDGNVIGLSAFGDPVPNGVGIDATFAAENRIGGPAGNTISANKTGIVIAGASASGNQILGNRIGTNFDGDAAIGNNTGILVNDAPGTIIGGPASAGSTTILGNVIAGSVPIPAESIFGHGIFVANANARDTIIQGNRIGTNADGTAALANSGAGILVSDASGAQIGGDGGGLGNLISGNGGDGITIFGNSGAPVITGTVIEGNSIGTNADGDTAIPNAFRGVHLDTNVTGTRVGGDKPGMRNLISGNGSDGVLIFGNLAKENEVFGNTIGLDAAGTEKLPNAEAGILILEAPDNLIGKAIDTTVFGNMISENLGDGVRIEGQNATGNIVIGNRIGLGTVGDEQFGNGGNGIRIIDASDNRIGPYGVGRFPIGANVISDNFDNGIRIEGTASGNQILGNGIGTAGNGAVDENLKVLGNLENGIEIIDAANNFVGGVPAVAIPLGANIPINLSANIIATNNFDGVRITGDTAIGNRILNNSIFLNAGQGIDLGPAGITDNDLANGSAADTDTGPNLLQNFPVIDDFETSADRATIRLISRLETTPNQTYTVQVFSNFQREAAGEGRNLLKTIEVAVGATGVATFNVDVDSPQPVEARGGQRASFFSMTATDPAGNTSEFSPSATAPELVIDDLDLTLENISFENGEFIFRDTIVVRNEGGRDVEGVLVQFRDQDGNTLEPLDLDQLINLPAPAEEPIDVSIDIEWDITELLLAAGGSTTLGLTATIDPNNLFKELVDDVENNEVSANLAVDIRPRIEAADVKREYKPGVFLAGVNLENEIRVESVDWNGNLPGSDLGSPVLRELKLEAGSRMESTIITGASSPPFDFSFDLGEDLSPGTSQVTLTATSFSQLPPTIFNLDYTQIENPAWIGDVFVTVEDVGEGPYDKIANYHAGFGFPGFATDGFFELPVSVKIGSGALGPEIGTYEVDLDFRSDGAATLAGTGPWSGMIAGRQVLPEVSVTLSGTAKPDNGTLKIVQLATTVSLAGEVETPKVPLPPPVSFLSAHGELSGELSTTLSVAEGPDGTLDWQPAGFGIGVGAALKISAGFEGLAYAEGGIGGNINANFNLPAEPCLLDDLSLQFALTAEVQVLVVSASYEFNFPDPPFMLAGCGGGEGEHLVRLVSEGESSTPTLTLAESTAGDHFATLGDDGLPDIRYRYAAPALAQADDGAKTLVWVDEDPSKPTEGQLEIVAARQVDGVWQSPIAITDDSLLDLQPNVALLPDGSPVAVWTHVGSAVADPDNPDPYALLGSMDLFYSKFDLTAGTWSTPALIAASPGMDYLPELIQTPTGVALIHLNDADGNTSLFPDDGRTIASSLRIAEFDGSTWSTTTTVAAEVDANTAPHAVLTNLGDGVDGLAVWESGSLGNQQGMRVAISRGGSWEPTILLADEPEAVSPQVIDLPEADAAGLVWLNQQVNDGPNPEDTVDVLYFARFENGELGVPEIIAKSAGISDPVLTLDESGRLLVAWVESFSDAVDVGYAVQDIDGVWGQAQRLNTPEDQLPWWLLPYVEGDQFNVLNLAKQITTESEGGEGEDSLGAIPRLTTSSLEISTARIGPDLEAGTIATSSPATDVLRLASTVTNVGDLASSATTAQLTIDGIAFGDRVAIGVLAPGESTAVSFDWDLPVDPTATIVVAITADPDDVVDETDESNNSAQLSQFLPNLAPQHIQAEIVGDDVVVSGQVVSDGQVPSGAIATVRLVADDPVTGEVLGETTIVSLAPGETADLAFTIVDARATLESVRTGFIVVDVTEAIDEQQEGFDNISGVALNPFESWTNPDDPFDVGGNGRHTAQDALLVINELFRNGSRRLPVPPTPSPFFDPNGDGRVSALDALVIINQLARDPSGAGEAVLSTADPLESQPASSPQPSGSPPPDAGIAPTEPAALAETPEFWIQRAIESTDDDSELLRDLAVNLREASQDLVAFNANDEFFRDPSANLDSVSNASILEDRSSSTQPLEQINLLSDEARLLLRR